MPPIRHGRTKGKDRPSLDDIFNGPDEFGLLDVQAKRAGSGAPLEVSRFDEINAFIDQAGRLPDSTGDLSEKMLARRLSGYIANGVLYEALRPYDRHGLLPQPKQPEGEPQISQQATQLSRDVSSMDALETSGPAVSAIVIEAEDVTSLDDIFASEAFAELDQGDESIFEMKHVPSVSEREVPDEIAQRTACRDFYAFEKLFTELHQKMNGGEIEVVRFQKETQIAAGDSFILQGVLCFIDEVGDYQEDEGGRYNPRLRVIFENGTESNLLLRSLARALYKDQTGRRIIRPADDVADAFNNITHKDKRAGQIYFVTTMSDNSNLKAIPNLIKIGYTEKSVEERTKNAERDTAFLEAPVKILASMECYNLNPNKFETLIHGFLHARRLKMTLIGKDGNTYHPKEWFSVPLDTAREIVRRIIDGSIVGYRMDNTTGRLVQKNMK